MLISILIANDKFRLFYSTVNFVVGKTITGYLIYPNTEKSDVFTFDELGDGIYSVIATITKKTNPDRFKEKYGLVIKENGVVKYFEILGFIAYRGTTWAKYESANYV